MGLIGSVRIFALWSKVGNNGEKGKLIDETETHVRDGQLTHLPEIQTESQQ